MKKEILHKKVATGVIVLGIRRVIYQAILTISNIILARILNPEIVGGFAIISFWVLSLGILTNFGLATALVQKKENVKDEALQTIFTTLVISSIIFAIIMYFLSPFIVYLYDISGKKLDPSAILWMRVFSLTILINHISSVSIRLLERKLSYIKLTIGEVFVLVVTQFATIFFSLKGFGIGSYVLGSVVGAIGACIIFYILSPWKIRINMQFSNLSSFQPFGFHYQVNSLVNAVHTAIIPVFVGAVSGSEAVGLLQWAGGLRQAAVAPFDIIEKIIFPTASRIQDDKKILKMLIEKMLKFSCLFSFPLLAILIALAPSIISIIYTSNWMNGLIALYISAIQGVSIIVSYTIFDVLLAFGKAKTIRNITIITSLLQWILTVPLLFLFGFNGAAFAGLLSSFTFFIALSEIKKYISIAVWPQVIPYLFYAISSGFLMYLVSLIFVIKSIWILLVIAALGAFFYFLLLLFFEFRELLKDFRKIYSIIMS